MLSVGCDLLLLAGSAKQVTIHRLVRHRHEGDPGSFLDQCLQGWVSVPVALNISINKQEVVVVAESLHVWSIIGGGRWGWW